MFPSGLYHYGMEDVMEKECFQFSCVSGGDELAELQPWRCVSVGHWQNHRSVEWAQEQQAGKTESKILEMCGGLRQLLDAELIWRNAV